MYLSYLRLSPTSAAVQRDLRDVEGLHRSIMRAFPEILDPEVKARAAFGVLHRVELDRTTGWILLYVQSQQAPDWSRLLAGYLVQQGDMPNPAVKPVGEIYDGLKAGHVLRFRLRANPTRKIDTKSAPDGTRRNGRRVPLNSPEAQVEWLSRKARANGFELLEASIAASGSPEVAKGQAGQITLQGVLFEGRLAVRDPECFRAALAGGIGPAKAFGFGLLSVGPA